MMARDPKPAVVFLRMSPQLREGLRAAANEAGCSLNAFAVQVLAAAAGDPARFRQLIESAGPAAAPEIERDARGYPLDWKHRWDHICSRQEYSLRTDVHVSGDEIRRIDREDPGFYVRWARERDAALVARQSADRPDAA